MPFTQIWKRGKWAWQNGRLNGRTAAGDKKNAGQSSQIRRDRRKTARPGPSGPAN